MAKVSLKAKNAQTLKKVKDIIDKTVIIKRQLELECGKWDFVVCGPKDRNRSVIREGFAKHLRIHQSSLYMATVGLPGLSSEGYERRGIPMEEFTNGDIPDEFNELEVFNVEPIRPISIVSRREGPAIDKTIHMIQKEYEDKNIAIIQAPDESCWGISILKYLNECDEYFPDIFIDAIKKGSLPVNAKFFNFDLH